MNYLLQYAIIVIAYNKEIHETKAMVTVAKRNEERPYLHNTL
jgi:hypothetical protein